MTREPTNERRRISPIVLGGISAIVLVAACLGMYLATSSDPAEADHRASASRPITPTPKIMLPSEAAIVTQLVGEKVCRECHPGESAQHALTGHARTLRRRPVEAIASWLNGRSVKDREYPEAVWTFSLAAGGKLEVERNEQGKSACYPVDYALGSGVNGVTFVSLEPRSGRDLPNRPGTADQLLRQGAEAGYQLRGKRRWTRQPRGSRSRRTASPGQGRLLVNCLNCHATITSTKGSGQFDPATMVPNISCERCHGPGRAHVEAARRGDTEEKLAMPMGSAVSAPPLRQLEVCGECHRRIQDVATSHAAHARKLRDCPIPARGPGSLHLLHEREKRAEL